MMCEKHNIINLKYFTKAQSRFAHTFFFQSNNECAKDFQGIIALEPPCSALSLRPVTVQEHTLGSVFLFWLPKFFQPGH